MAALMFLVPPDTARVLHEIPVPGTPERHDPHITVMYLGKDVPVEKIADMLPVIYNVTSKTAPFSVTTNHVSHFPGGDDGEPIIAKLTSPPLHAFRQELCDAFDEAGVEYDKKFPEYKPHTTLAYNTGEKSKFDMDIPEVTWGCNELVLWGSNRGSGRLVLTFPLSLPQGKVASATCRESYVRATVRLARWKQIDEFA